MGARETIVAYCRWALGCSYDYTPSGGVEGESYNCSFLSFCAYRHAGLEIPTWQGHQHANGSQSDWVRWNGNWVTDLASLRVGDLVFFGDSPTNTGHVGVVSREGDAPYIIDSTPSRGVAERQLPVSAGFVGGGWPLPDEPARDVPQFPLTVRFPKGINVRDFPSTTLGTIVTHYEKGETCVIDGIVACGGYCWGTYVGTSSGKRRYVALGDMDLAEVVS